MRKKLLVTILILATLGIAGVAQAQVSSANLWKLVSNAIFPVKSTWEFGSATSRIQKGWFNNLDANNATIGSIGVSGSVAGDMVVSGQIRNATGTQAAPSYSFNSDTNSGLYSGGADILKFANGGADSLTILANGNMGVATATPTYKMDINGTLRANSTITFNSLASTTSTLITASTAGTLSSIANNSSNWDAGYNYRVTGAVAPLALSSNSLSIPAASASVNGYLATSTFATFNNKVSSQWTTNGSNVYYTTGSVGIGTSAPTSKLDVNGDVYANNYGVTNGNGYGYRFWQSDSYKIDMSNDTYHQYGPVTDYSIKTTMDNGAGRGFTWGRYNATPIAALNAYTGDFKVAGKITGKSGSQYGQNGIIVGNLMPDALAYSSKKGRVTVTSGVINNIDNAFDMMDSSYANIPVANLPAVMEIDLSSDPAYYAGGYRLSFDRHTNADLAVSFKLEGYYSGAWSTIDDQTANGSREYMMQFGNGVHFEKVRLTMRTSSGAKPNIGLESFSLFSSSGYGTNYYNGALPLGGGTLYGNLGIGKNPATNLDIVGGINSTGTVNGTGLCISGDCKASWSAIAAAGAGWNRTAPYVYPSTLTDNVGIGLTNPSYKLDVSGSIHGTSYYSSDGTIGTSTTINVRKADDTGACTITVKNGLITTTTCP